MSRNNGYAILTVFVAALAAGIVQAAPTGKEATDMKSAWFKEHLTDSKSSLPFSFTYDGQPSKRLLAEWPAKAADERLDANRTRRTLTWTDPKTGLEVRCVAVDYVDYPAVEWTVWFKNAGPNHTPILEDIQGLDARFERGALDSEFVLNGIKGDFCTADSFEPYRKVLAPGSVAQFAPPDWSGKSCDGPAGWPYFNLQTPGGGVILAVGWPGQWASSFGRDAATGLTVRAGQQLTRLHLKPGEEIRTPLIALLFWQGPDVIAAQNLWRHWYRVHNLPWVGGKPQPAVSQIQVGGRERDIAYVQKFLDARIHVDLCWRDAGGTREEVWFKIGADPLPYTNPGMIWLNSGTWEPDPQKFPNGFKPFSDWVRARQMQFVLWFEPERVGDLNSWLGKNHPEWLLPGTSHGALLDEGNPAARQWLTNHISGMVTTQGLDWYREDMNGSGPLRAWRRNDKPDRQGMTENLYVQGHLAFWDELRRRHPHLRIDSCASGGRRNDLETMRRAVPLLRSDFQLPNMPGVVEGNQGHTYGLSFWLPFQGSGVYNHDPYAYRSFYMPSFGMGHLTPENTAAQQKAYGECRKIAPIMLEGDYYPLTPYSLKLDQWIGWQFNRPEQGDGVVQAFRRGQCEPAAQTYRLRGLDPAATYELTNFDVAGTTVASGKDLMDKGLPVEIKDKPGAAVIVYRRDKTAGTTINEDPNMKNAWFKGHLAGAQTTLPFSFMYDGQPSAKLLAEWPAKAADERLDANRTRRTLTWTDPKTGLEVKCIAVEYVDYPAAEWTVWFKNTGKADTPILKDIQGLDATFSRPAQGEFVLHGNKGDWNAAEGFEPYRRTLAPGSTQRFAPNGPVAAGWNDVAGASASGATQRFKGNGGRPTNGPDGWPYYNVQWTGGGFILAIGWPGQWAASFSRDEKTALRIAAGQELTHLSLKPGEEIRSPLTALLFWQGDDVVSAQNLWRHWYMAHNIPKIDGKPPAPITMMQLAPTCTGSEQEQFAEVKKYEDAGIEIDLYWNDAGWYPCGGKWPNTGTWEIDAARYPNGFKPIADRVHAKGKKLIVWFEPERVGDQNSWLAKNHPEWLIGGDREPRSPEEARKWKELGRRLTHNAELVNLGNPEARQWVIERVDSILKTNRIDHYRQDFNHPDPLGVWRRNDAPNRQGMTENLHVQGYLAFWDELLRRHPGMLIDTCASGGRRLDLETLRRSVPLLRSDFQSRPGVTEGNQGHTYGLSSWLPFQGSGVLAHDAYTYRSFYLPSFGMGELTPKSAAAVQKAYGECRRIAPLMLFGDYYPLTPYSLKLDQWIGWQFNRPERGDGVVQAFRRGQCEPAAQTYRLRGLDPAATYEVTNFDVESATRVSGKDLIEKGLTVEIKDKPGAAVIVYRRVEASMPR